VITTTRNVVRNLFILSATRRPDGKVVIRFSIMKAGTYYNVRQFTKAFNKKFPAGFVMTPAITDPMHSRDPIMVPFPGAVFNFVWDAPRDGFGTGSLYGTTFQLAYVDFLCCDEIEGGFWEPGGSVPPGIRPPPLPPVPPPDPGDPGIPPSPPPPPDPGVPSQPPPTQPPDPSPVPEPTVVPATEQPPNTGNTEPPAVEPPVVSTDQGQPVPDGGVVKDPIPAPVVPPWMPPPLGTSTETPGGTPIVPTPVLEPEPFPYIPFTDVTQPPKPVVVGVPQPIVQVPVLPPTMTPEQQALMLHMMLYRPMPPYPITPQFAGLFAVPENPAT